MESNNISSLFNQEVREFRPSVGARIRFFLGQFFAAVFLLFALFGLSTMLPFRLPVPVYGAAVAVALAIVLYRTIAVPASFRLVGKEITVVRGNKEQSFSLDDYYVSAETYTQYVYFIPMTSRKIIFTPVNPAPKEKPVAIKLSGYSKKDFAQLMSTTRRLEDLRAAELRQEAGVDTPDQAAGAPVVRDGTAGTVDSSLNPSNTYAIVTDPTDLVARTSMGVIIGLVILGGAGLFMGVVERDFFMLVMGVVLIAIAVLLFARRSGSRLPKNTMLGAEISPEGLVISLQGDNARFPWDQIQAIRLTPIGYSGGEYRSIQLDTSGGAYKYVYGTENNAKLDENFSWFTEYLKLHALDKIEYLYR